MILASVIASCEDEFICDMTETYGIYDYKGLPPMTCATLCCGLPDDSRVKRKLSNMKLSLTEMLLALIVDGINTLIWQPTKDGRKGRNKPESLFKKLMGLDKKPKDELQAFDDTEAFETWYRSKHG